jgi:hypothetical protein
MQGFATLFAVLAARDVLASRRGVLGGHGEIANRQRTPEHGDRVPCRDDTCSQRAGPSQCSRTGERKPDGTLIASKRSWFRPHDRSSDSSVFYFDST